ncbi:MAG: PQQ-binding-like beta-propeller repeat protein [Anaerolineaceae bacterium]|nr:PQQ-binding-like beta-propeller repeat protein [Anaerolineaceae bacterium]
MKTIGQILLLLVLPLAGTLGYLAGNTLARMNDTVALADEVLGPSGPSDQDDAEESFEVQAFRSRGGDPDQLRGEALAIERKFRLGAALFGLWCGLVAVLKIVSLGRVPRRTDCQIEQGICMTCGRCFISCPKEHLARKNWTGRRAAGRRRRRRGLQLIARLRGDPLAPRLRSVLLPLAIVAAVFSAIVVAVMLGNYFTEFDAPWREPPEMARLQQRLAAAPDDQQTIEQIRQVDATLRADFFRRRALMADGRWLLAVALGIMVLCLHGYVWLGRRSEAPPLDLGAEEPDWEVVARRNARAVGLAATVLAVALVGLIVLVPAVDFAETRTVEIPNWPRFRGPTGMGLAPEGDWPTEWDAAAGQNILWATDIVDPEGDIPAEGNNSPVLWGDRIYLTTADAEQRWVHCFDAADGKVLWRTRVKSPPNSPMATKTPQVTEDTGYAAPTAAVDAQGVYVTFANADVACIGHDGRQKWAVNLGVPDNVYGLASSMVPYRSMVILQHDQGDDPAAGKSTILALDTRSGRTVWETVRPVRASWSTPIIVRVGDHDELVTAAEPWIIAYNPATGDELWRAASIDGDVGPSPVYAGGLVLMANDFSRAVAVRAGGSGDVTRTRVLWTDATDLPNMVSPVADAERYLQVENYGKLTCYRTGDGKIIWRKDVNAQMTPSPSLVGKLVYLPTLDGRMLIFPLGDEFRLLSTGSVGQPTTASPVFVGGRIYIRGKSKLFCIGRARERRE